MIVVCLKLFVMGELIGIGWLVVIMYGVELMLFFVIGFMVGVLGVMLFVVY